MSLHRRDLLTAAALVLLAALVRLPRLAATPGWDGDEGYNLDIAWHLLHGRAQSFALAQAFVQHPVGFYATLAPLLALFGRDLLVARALAAAAASLTAGAIYLATVGAGSGRRSALFAGLAYALASFVVAYNRFAYTYTLLLFWAALALLFLTLWEERRRAGLLWAAGAAAALGALTDHAGLALPALVAARALPNRRAALLSLAGGIAPAALAAAVMLVVHGETAAQDWRQSFARVGTGAGAGADAGAAGGAAAQAARWFVNYFHLLRAEWWWPAAVAGLFCVRPLTARRRLLLLGGLLALPTFALREIEPFFRTAIPLLLPAAAGLGALLDTGLAAVFATFSAGPPSPSGGGGVRRRLAGAAVAALLVVLPLGLEGAKSAGALVAGHRLRIDWALAHDQAAARAAAGYVNARIDPGDVVLTSPHVSWLYRGRVADFLQAVAWQGDAIGFYPRGVLRQRFRFEPSTAQARYVVVDDFWERWREVSAPLDRLTGEVEAWPLALRAGEYRVYRRP